MININTGVLENMEFCYDVSGYYGYLGSNKSWIDLSSANMNRFARLSGSVSYSLDFGGSLTFFTESSANFTVPPVFLTTQSFAVEVWFRPNRNESRSDAYPGVISCVDLWAAVDANSKTGWGIGENTTQANFTYGTVTTSSVGVRVLRINGPTKTNGQLYHLFLQRNTISQSLEMYHNGVLFNSASLSNSASISSSGNINMETYAVGPVNTNNHTYYAMKMYTNRVFTANEIANNYNYFLKRFS